MNVTFTSSSMTNSTIINTATRNVLFELSNPFSLALDTITMYDPQKQVIAIYKEGWVSDDITYQGQTRPLYHWLYKDNIFSNSRKFVAVNGKTYKWDDRELIDCQTKEVVAKAHRVRWGILSEPRKLNIDVTSNVIPILDAIVFTFVVCEMLGTRRRRRREREIIAHKAAWRVITGGGQT
ncbi:hypothetical protein C8Q78DRAFT_1033227 [Trametes maxima]|nr:hypothetical protein C8Q78DRAFT_1033227 [Trametes maxima]